MSREQDRIFVVTFVGVIAFLVAIAIVLIVLASVAGESPFRAEERQRLEHARAADRLAPVGQVRLSGEPMPELEGRPAPTQAAAEDLTPAKIYESACMSCHATGVMNAPRTGEAGDWKPRLADRGFQGLVDNAINGLNAMPPRGGNPRLSDEQITETVRYMLQESGVSAD